MTKTALLLLYFLFVLGLLGFGDAMYLTVLHYQNAIPPCSLAHGCESVLTSKYAMIGPIPIALIGALYYLSFLIGLFVFSQTKNTLIPKLLFLATSIGLVVAGILISLQAFVIHAFCQYCLASEAVDILLFISTILFQRNVKSANTLPQFKE